MGYSVAAACLPPVFRSAQLDFAIVANGIAHPRVSIERQADAVGIGKRLTANLSNHWQVSVPAENEIGFNAFKGSWEERIANFWRDVESVQLTAWSGMR